MSGFEVTTMRLLQALAACLTVVVYLLRRHCVLVRCPVKCSSYGIQPSSVRDPQRLRAAQAALAASAAAAVSERPSLGCSASLSMPLPRCKQDPVIKDFTVPPLE